MSDSASSLPLPGDPPPAALLEALAWRDRRLAELLSENADLERATLPALGAELAELERERAALQLEVAEQDARAARARAAAAEAELARVRAELAGREARVAELLASWSWRVSAPLRGVLELARALRGRRGRG